MTGTGDPRSHRHGCGRPPGVPAAWRGSAEAVALHAAHRHYLQLTQLVLAGTNLKLPEEVLAATRTHVAAARAAWCGLRPPEGRVKALRARVASHTQSEAGITLETQQLTLALAAATTRLCVVKEELAKAKTDLEEHAVPEAAARERDHDDAEGKAAPDLLAAFTPLRV